MVLYLFCSEPIARLCDSLFYVSPVTVAMFLVLSKILRLCIWHRAACIVPIVPQMVSLADYYIVELPISLTAIINILIATLLTILLFSAYKVFFK